MIQAGIKLIFHEALEEREKSDLESAQILIEFFKETWYINYLQVSRCKVFLKTGFSHHNSKNRAFYMRLW